jgi:hypothetical protein
MMMCCASLGFAISPLRSQDKVPEAKKTPQVEQAPQHLDFYLLIGQSNMAGRGKYKEGEDKFPRNTAYVLNDKGKFVQLQPYPFINHYSSIRKSAAQISPGYSFGLALLKANPDKPFAFVSNARGGTSINEWVKGTKYFDEAIRRTKEALAEGGHLKAILWHQGETDYREIIKHKGEENKYLEEYFDKLKQFIKDLRAEIGDENVPFIAGQVNSGFKLFNDRILKLPEEVKNTYVVKTDGLTTVDDSHFDRDSVLELGKRYAEIYLSTQKDK